MITQFSLFHQPRWHAHAYHACHRRPVRPAYLTRHNQGRVRNVSWEANGSKSFTHTDRNQTQCLQFAIECSAPSIAALVQRRSYLAQCKHRRAYDNSVLLRCMVFCCAARAPPWLGFVKSARQPVGQQCSGVMHQAAPSRGRTKRPSTMSSTMRHKTLRSLRMYCHVG